jgi:hypothetical protein
VDVVPVIIVIIAMIINSNRAFNEIVKFHPPMPVGEHFRAFEHSSATLHVGEHFRAFEHSSATLHDVVLIV